MAGRCGPVRTVALAADAGKSALEAAFPVLGLEIDADGNGTPDPFALSDALADALSDALADARGAARAAGRATGCRTRARMRSHPAPRRWWSPPPPMR
jgi:hypothetical protein